MKTHSCGENNLNWSAYFASYTVSKVMGKVCEVIFGLGDSNHMMWSLCQVDREMKGCLGCCGALPVNWKP